MLEEFDEELLTPGRVGSQGELELRLVTDRVAEKAHMRAARRGAFDDTAVEDGTMAIEMQILQGGLKAVCALEVEDFKQAVASYLLGTALPVRSSRRTVVRSLHANQRSTVARSGGVVLNWPQAIAWTLPCASI